MIAMIGKCCTEAREVSVKSKYYIFIELLHLGYLMRPNSMDNTHGKQIYKYFMNLK